MSKQLTEILEVAKILLKNAGTEGMHVSEMAASAVEQNRNFGLNVDDFKIKLNAALSSHVKREGTDVVFRKVTNRSTGKPKKGYYRLKRQVLDYAGKGIEIPDVSKAHTGKAGEFAVLSELLFWGYNACVMSIDDGVDLIASKENRYFHIQVKTSIQNGSGKFTFSIKETSFDLHHALGMFYVFVLRQGLKNEFIVIPSSHIKRWRETGVIRSQKDISLTISISEGGRKYLLNGQVDVTSYYGKFGDIV